MHCTFSTKVRDSAFLLDLEELRSLVVEAEKKSYPETDLLSHLRQVIQNADRCTSMAQQLLNGKRQTRYIYSFWIVELSEVLARSLVLNGCKSMFVLIDIAPVGESHRTSSLWRNWGHLSISCMTCPVPSDRPLSWRYPTIQHAWCNYYRCLRCWSDIFCLYFHPRLFWTVSNSSSNRARISLQRTCLVPLLFKAY